MTQLIPYIAYPSAKKALAYYQRVFNATDMKRLSPTPQQAGIFGLPADADLDALTMHAEFTVLGTKLMCSDAFGHDAKPNEQISLMLMIDPKDAELGDRFYQHLVDSGEVTVDMPYATQFWGDKMGQVTDAFGVVWRLQQAPA